MEIERKYLIREIPFDLSGFTVKNIEQGYICTSPVIRIRKEDSSYILTVKSKGLLIREEYELPLEASSYEHLRTKVEGRIIQKKRYLIPYSEDLTIELDVFAGDLEPLMLAEVEFTCEADALSFSPPDWFGEDVTFSGTYQNSVLCRIPEKETP